MDYQKIKIFLLVALAVIAGLLWTKWEAIYNPPPVAVVQTATTVANNNNQIPNVSISTSDTNQAKPSITSPIVTQTSESTVAVNTDLVNLKIDLLNGGITYAQLQQYPDSLHSAQPIVLLNNQADNTYLAQSGLVGTGLPAQLQFKADQTSYSMGNQNQLVVNLTWSNNKGLSIVKSYTFTKNSYSIAVNYSITNKGKQAWVGRFYGQLVRTPPVVAGHGMLSVYRTYTGAALSTPTNHYQKVTFADMQEQNINQTATGGWVAMLQHYFITAWVPDQTQTNDFFSNVYNNKYGIGLATPQVTAAPNQTVTTGANLYIGPAIASNLQAAAPYLDKTIDYGLLWFISQLIFTVMKFIHSFIGNWGWSIVMVTILIKLLFSPLSAKSYGSMARMRMLAPKIAKLKERCGDDKQKLGKATMDLYREEKVNPLGGCLPMLIQIPVFIALYWMIMESVELRQAPFIFWIHDLSARDPYFIMPLLMGASMFLQQRLNPAPADPTQAKVMMMMPIIFTVMFLSFPSGLVLYWLVNNCVSILQQWWIIRRFEKQVK
ncbi:MAG: membrane protein insertase YidC [Gammaproteobacteria bacterium]|nr:membrane protein insertase YidC [Gammaproteobacteria bacterium]